MIVWINAGRNLRYREHKTRKHGQRPDRFWSLHYTVNKRSRNEGVGWWSQGVTQAVCRELLAELQRNWRTGAGPQTLKELREVGQAKAKAQRGAEPGDRQGRLTLGEFWTETVQPQINLTYTKGNISQCAYLARSCYSPLLERPLADITVDDLENFVVRPLLEAGRRPHSIEGALGFFSVIWHKAKKLKLVQGVCPVSQVNRPRLDNRRVRFLTPDEASRLLAALQKRSQIDHDMALLSLFTGLRSGECSALTWPDIDFDNGLIFVKDTKNSDNRHAFMTAEVRAMLTRRRSLNPKPGWVFYGRFGGRVNWSAQRPFREVVRALGFNEGIADPRQKVVLHTLRHTFASWLVMKGQPLYTVGKLLGHRDIRMTQRYAHLSPEVQQAAVAQLEGFLAHSNEVTLHTNGGK